MSELYNNYPCTMDLDLTVYDGDRDGYIAFGEDEAIQHALAAFREEHGTYNARKDLLKSSLRLTPKLAPEICKIGDRCKEILGMNANIEFYVYQDSSFNACCYPPDDKRLYIMLSSALLEQFNPTEIAFVIGHEIGHVLYDHMRYPARPIMDYGQGTLSPLHAMKLFAWGRSAELSADRIGLLCCQSFEAAGSSFFKLSSGVTSDSLNFHIDEYIDQYRHLSAEMAEAEVDPSDWYSTHPFSPMRIKALEVFANSETYNTLIGKPGEFKYTEEEMEQEIAQFMSLMDPDYLTEESETGNKIQGYIFKAGIIIAAADGQIDPEEIQTLGTLISPEVFNAAMEEINANGIDIPEMQGQVHELAQDLNTFLSHMQKLNVIRDLALIASADGEIDPGEMNVLYHLCQFFNVHPEFADDIIASSQKELD